MTKPKTKTPTKIPPSPADARRSPPPSLTAPPPPLTTEERQQLRAMFDSPVFRRALELARQSAPALFHQGGEFAGEHGVQNAANRLFQLQGWALFRAALLMQSADPSPKRSVPHESFPDAGLPYL